MTSLGAGSQVWGSLAQGGAYSDSGSPHTGLTAPPEPAPTSRERKSSTQRPEAQHSLQAAALTCAQHDPLLRAPPGANEKDKRQAEPTSESPRWSSGGCGGALCHHRPVICLGACTSQLHSKLSCLALEYGPEALLTPPRDSWSTSMAPMLWPDSGVQHGHRPGSGNPLGPIPVPSASHL